MDGWLDWGAESRRRSHRALVALVVLVIATEIAASTLFQLPHLDLFHRALLIVPALFAFWASLWTGQRGGIILGIVAGAYSAFYLVAHGTVGDLRDRAVFGGTLGLIILGTCVAMGRHRDTAVQLRMDAVRAERARAAAAEMRSRELAQANTVLRDFTHVVAHDLRNPVRGIQALLSDLEGSAAGRLTDDEREAVSMLRREAKRLGVLLEELLDYSRVNRVGDLTMRTVRVGDVLLSDSCRARYEPALRETGASLRTDGLERLVYANAGALEIVLGNLLANAARHGGRRGVRIDLRVEGSEREGFADIVVEDDGVGFSADLVASHARMAAGAEDRDPGHSGFGLLLVTRAAQRLGGSVKLGASAAGGASVRVALPAAAAIPAEGDAGVPRTAGPGTP